MANTTSMDSIQSQQRSNTNIGLIGQNHRTISFLDQDGDASPPIKNPYGLLNSFDSRPLKLQNRSITIDEPDIKNRKKFTEIKPLTFRVRNETTVLDKVLKPQIDDPKASMKRFLTNTHDNFNDSIVHQTQRLASFDLNKSDLRHTRRLLELTGKASIMKATDPQGKSLLDCYGQSMCGQKGVI